MNLGQRINELEKHSSKMHLDPVVNVELATWFKSFPQYVLFAQPESSNGIVMPEHLSYAFGCRMNKLFTERNLTPTLSNLIKIASIPNSKQTQIMRKRL